jgi:hypothetical protein
MSKPLIRIILTGKIFPPIRFIGKNRKARRYFYTSDLIINSTVSTGDPQWRNWIMGIISLITTANTTDLALTGLSSSVSLPFVLNLAFVGINVALAIYHLKNFVISSFVVIKAFIKKPSFLLLQDLFKHIIKLGLIAGICYGLAHAALFTLAAFTPGVNLLLSIVFVINAIAIGVTLATVAGNMFIPFVQKTLRNLYYKIKNKNPPIVQLPDYMKKKITQNNLYAQTLSSDTLEEIKSHDLQNSPRETDLELSRRMRLTLAHYFHAESTRLLEIKPFSSLFRSQRIQACISNLYGVVNQGDVSKNTSPLRQYISRFEGLINKIAYDIIRSEIIRIRFDQYQNAKEENKLKAAYNFLKSISYKNGYFLETNIKIDGLKTATDLLNTQKYPSKKRGDFVKILRDHIFFETKSTDLTGLLREIKTIALKELEERYPKKMRKLHDNCKLDLNKIGSLLSKRIKKMIEEEKNDCEYFNKLFSTPRRTREQKEALNQILAFHQEQLNTPLDMSGLNALKNDIYTVFCAIEPENRIKAIINNFSQYLKKSSDKKNGSCPFPTHLNHCSRK